MHDSEFTKLIEANYLLFHDNVPSDNLLSKLMDKNIFRKEDKEQLDNIVDDKKEWGRQFISVFKRREFELRNVFRLLVDENIEIMKIVLKYKVTTHTEKTKLSSCTYKASCNVLGSSTTTNNAGPVCHPSTDIVEELKLDDTQPQTTILIRLADGSKLEKKKFNVTHTVADINTFIRFSKAIYSSSNFILMTTNPSREFREESITIKDANLENTVVIQKMI